MLTSLIENKKWNYLVLFYHFIGSSLKSCPLHSQNEQTNIIYKHKINVYSWLDMRIDPKGVSIIVNLKRIPSFTFEDIWYIKQTTSTFVRKKAVSFNQIECKYNVYIWELTYSEIKVKMAIWNIMYIRRYSIFSL